MTWKRVCRGDIIHHMVSREQENNSRRGSYEESRMNRVCRSEAGNDRWSGSALLALLSIPFLLVGCGEEEHFKKENAAAKSKLQELEERVEESEAGNTKSRKALDFIDPPKIPGEKNGKKAQAGASSEERSDKVVWEGYLWKDKEARIRFGSAVIASGVGRGPDRIVEGELAHRLAPFVSQVNSEFYFWNGSWIGREPDPMTPPRAIIRLKGTRRTIHKVTYEELQRQEKAFREGRYPGRTPLDQFAMAKAQVLWIEVLPQKWLDSWRELAGLGFDPWYSRPESKVETDKKKVGDLAAKVMVSPLSPLLFQLL